LQHLILDNGYDKTTAMANVDFGFKVGLAESEKPLLVEKRKAENARLDPTRARSLSNRGAPAAASQHHPAPR